MLNEEAYLNRRTENWRRLNDLLNKSAGTLRRLSGDELLELIRLYRQTSSDLAYMTTHSSNADVVSFLNRLVARAYTEIYRLPKSRTIDVVRDWLAFAAQTVRKRFVFILLSIVIFFAGAFFSYTWMRTDPAVRPYFVSRQAEPNHEHWMKAEFEQRTAAENMQMTGFYSQNNPMVGIMLNALGLATFGIMSFFSLWQNGVAVGALAADMTSVGKLGFLLSSLFPHGVPEIGGFFVMGGSAFTMAWAMINPKDKTRGDAVREVAKESGALAILALIMIFLAAPIEGFFSFNPAVPQWLKVVLGAAGLAAWICFFVFYGRKEKKVSKAIR